MVANCNKDQNFITGLDNIGRKKIDGAMGVIYSTKPDDACYAIGHDTE